MLLRAASQMRLRGAKRGEDDLGRIEERMHELSLTIGRLCAGKSAQFQQFCAQALRLKAALPLFKEAQ